MKMSYSLSYKILILIIILSGCSNNSITVSENMDPFESMNRQVFSFNKKVDEKIISPISSTYEKEIPASTRKAIRNHIDWLDSQNRILNSSFQIDFKNTILASAKFILNGFSTENPFFIVTMYSLRKPHFSYQIFHLLRKSYFSIL